MADVQLTICTVDNASAKGTVMPALRGGGAQHYTRTVTTSAMFEISATDWVASGRGYVRIVSDAKLYVRFVTDADDTTAAAAGAGWPVLANQPEVFSVEPGDRIRWAAA